MNSLQTFVKNHRAALLLALAVGVMYVSFHIFAFLFISKQGGEYAPVLVEGGFDEGYYALRAAEAFDGDFLVGDINLFEYQNSPAFLPILNPLLMAALGRIALSMNAAFILSDLIFPALIVIFSYLIFFELTGRKKPALLFSALCAIAPKFALFPSSAALPFLSSPRELYFSRFDYPNITFVFFAAALYAILRALRRRERLTTLIAGCFTGILFYTYFFDWMYVFTALFLMAVIFLFRKRSAELKLLLKIFFIALLISIPYWINFFALIHLPSYGDLIERIGVETGRMFRLEIVWTSYLRAGIFAFLVSLLWKFQNRGVYLISLLLPIFFLLNLQVLTGIVPQPDHWHRTQFLALDLAAGLFLLFIFDRVRHTLPSVFLRYASVSVIISLCGYGFFSQYATARAVQTSFVVDRETRNAYRWLEENVPEKSVVAALSSRTNNEIVFRTRHFVFVPNGFHTVAPTEEVWLRAMSAASLIQLTPEEFRRFIEEQTIYLFVDQYRNREFNAYFKHIARKIPEDILDRKVNDYRKNFYGVSPPVSYRLDYILLGSYERSFKGYKDFARTHVAVYNDGRTSIFRYPQ